MNNLLLLPFLIVFFAAAAIPQDYSSSELISWMALADRFPRVLNGEVADEELEGTNHHAGPASSSEVSCEYGNGRYTLTMRYATENCNTKQTVFSRYGFTDVDGKAVRDSHRKRFTVNGFIAYGEYDQFGKTATATVFLENCVSVCVKTINAKGLGDAAVVFNTIDIDKINKLEP